MPGLLEEINSDVAGKVGPWIQWELYYQPLGLDGKWVHYGSYHDEVKARLEAGNVITSKQVMGVKVEPL